MICDLSLTWHHCVYFFLPSYFSESGFFFRNVTESLVEVERYNSNTQNVFTWTGGVSIMGAIQNLIVCVKMAWSEHLAGSDCGDEYSLNTLM